MSIQWSIVEPVRQRKMQPALRAQRVLSAEDSLTIDKAPSQIHQPGGVNGQTDPLRLGHQAGHLDRSRGGGLYGAHQSSHRCIDLLGPLRIAPEEARERNVWGEALRFRWFEVDDDPAEIVLDGGRKLAGRCRVENQLPFVSEKCHGQERRGSV